MDNNIRRISQQDILPNKQAVLDIMEHYKSEYEEALRVVCLAQDLKNQKELEKQELLHIEKLASKRRDRFMLSLTQYESQLFTKHDGVFMYGRNRYPFMALGEPFVRHDL